MPNRHVFASKRDVDGKDAAFITGWGLARPTVPRIVSADLQHVRKRIAGRSSPFGPAVYQRDPSAGLMFPMVVLEFFL